VVDPWSDVATGWRLLSYGRPVTATSSLADHGPELVTNEDIRTWWVAGGAGAAEGVTVDLGAGCTVTAVQVNLADHHVALAKAAPDLGDNPPPGLTRFIEPLGQPTAYRVEVSPDAQEWTAVGGADDGRDRPHRLVVLGEPVAARWVRVIGGPGSWGSPLAISGVRVFGEREGDPPAPATAASVSVERLDAMTARVTWQGHGAQGANIRYGCAPDALYHSWLVHGRDELVVPTLNAGVDYWLAVDCFNGSGVSAGEVVAVPSAVGRS
jgi:hypothetical protein